MNLYCVFLFLTFLKLCMSFENLWHSYQHDPIHKSREEIAITKVIADNSFNSEFVVTKWKSLHTETTCYLAGLMEKSLAISSVNLNSSKDGFIQTSFRIDISSKPVDVALFEFWDSRDNVMVVVATKQELLWYKIDQNYTLFWSWNLRKNISHINVFQIESDYQILIINEYESQISADLYEFIPSDFKNFWLRQKIPLSDAATSSAVSKTGPDYFLAFPQKSSVLIYKFHDNHYSLFQNLTSRGVNDVIIFTINHKIFLAINGINAGIYRFLRKDLIRENVTDSNVDSVNYWLPIPIDLYGDNTVLIAQRSLNHGLHRSFVIEVITYNGERFEEHEDIPCLYFGEEIGLSCLPDEEAQKGIRGSVAISLENTIGLVIPRLNKSSEIFLLKTELKKIANPLHKHIEDFQERKTQIDGLIAIQQERYNNVLKNQLNLTEIELQVDEIENGVEDLREKFASIDLSSVKFNTVVFNGLTKVINTGVFDEVYVKKINSEAAKDLLENIVLKSNVSLIKGSKVFQNLEMDNLEFNSINGINASNLVFTKDSVELNGDLFLTQSLNISEDLKTEEVNGLKFEKEVISIKGEITDELSFENLKTDNVAAEKINNLVRNFEFDELYIKGSLQVENVNGESFDTFLQKLCLKNINNFIPGTFKVDGEVTVLANAETKFLNGLIFPLDYVFTDNSSPNITGFKNFTNLLTSEMNIEGTIDGISTSEIITLKTDQTIPGTITFENLKITEGLNVEGNITGKHASKFLPNPTLLESNFIKSKVHFKHLQVDGVIIITENLNGNNFGTDLSDIIYQTEKTAVIVAMKQFPEGFKVNNLTIESNSINNVNLDQIVTKNTEQELNISLINGIVSFGNVEVNKFYDSIDVKKMDEELVKLSGEQYLSSTLIFENKLYVDELEVLEKLQSFNNLNNTQIENVYIDGNFYGNINEFDLEDFNKRRLSYTEDQTLKNLKINNLFVENFQADSINGRNVENYNNQKWENILKSKLLKGKLSVKNLFSNNSVNIANIDGQTVSNLAGSFWKKSKIQNLTFYDDVYFDNIDIINLSGVNFRQFVQNIIFKNETNVTLKGKKNFTNGFSVEKLIETEKLNNIHLENILTKYGKQEIISPLTILGSVEFLNAVTISKGINNIPIKNIVNVYQSTNDSFIIKGDVLFSRLPHIYHLQINGSVDNRNAQEVIDGIIYKNQDFKLKNLIKFENQIKIDRNIRVKGQVNNINLPAFVSDMIMITKDTTILCPIQFAESVNIQNQMILHKKLSSKLVNDFDVKSWIDNAIFVNKGLLSGNYSFQDVQVFDNLKTDFINDIDTKTLIPLRSEQNLTELSFSEIAIFNDVSVGNSTNHLYLPEEYKNTVLVNFEQEINSEVEFRGKVFIEEDMKVNSINNINPDKIVTTNTDQNLFANYNFKSKINIEKNLTVDGLLNGIDIKEWEARGVKTIARQPQNITDNWLIDGDLIFEEDTLGDGLISHMDMQKLKDEVGAKLNEKYSIEKRIIDDYTNICKDLTDIYHKLKRQIYKFDYLEKLQTLKFHRKIAYFYYYEYQNNFYLIINEQKKCESYLFFFDENSFRFIKNIHFGLVAQIIPIHLQNSLFLVVRNQLSYSLCKTQGTTIWQINGTEFKNLAIIDDQDLLQDSSIPGTFYGLKNKTVTEFKLIPNSEIPVIKYRKWNVNISDNLAFAPRGFGTGLALHTGKHLIKLHRNDSTFEDLTPDIEKIIIGNSTEEYNMYFPGRKSSDFVVMSVGIKSSKRNLLAVASHEETSVKSSLDFIKIYEDVITGKMFQKLASYKPSALASLELDNGQTFLIFMEDRSVLQVYEYKGVEGFRHNLSVKLKGSKIFIMNVINEKLVGIVDKNQIHFVKVIMCGNQVEKNLRCMLN